MDQDEAENVGDAGHPAFLVPAAQRALAKKLSNEVLIQKFPS